MNSPNLNSSIGNTYKLVPIDSVLQDIYRVIDTSATDSMSEDDILESASWAAHQIYNHKYFEDAICIAAYENHNLVLPDYRKIAGVFWRPEMSDDEFEETIGTMIVDMGESPYMVTSRNVYTTNAVPFIDAWNMAYPKHSVSTLVHMNANDQLSMGGNCSITYSVKECVLTMSKEKGFALVLYDRLLRNDEGQLLVPFIPQVPDAIRSFVLMEMHLRQLNSHRDGSAGLYRLFKDEWEVKQAEIRAKLMMLDLPEWISMNEETNKLIQGGDPYERHMMHNNPGESIYLGSSRSFNGLYY